MIKKNSYVSLILFVGFFFPNVRGISLLSYTYNWREETASLSQMGKSRFGRNSLLRLDLKNVAYSILNGKTEIRIRLIDKLLLHYYFLPFSTQVLI